MLDSCLDPDTDRRNCMGVVMGLVNGRDVSSVTVNGKVIQTPRLTGGDIDYWELASEMLDAGFDIEHDSLIHDTPDLNVSELYGTMHGVGRWRMKGQTAYVSPDKAETFTREETARMVGYGIMAGSVGGALVVGLVWIIVRWMG